MTFEHLTNKGNYRNGGRKPDYHRKTETGTVVRVKPETDPDKIKELFEKAKMNNRPLAAETIIIH